MSSSGPSSPLTGLTPLEMEWIINFWQHPSAPPIHLHSSSQFLSIVERVHGHFSNVQAQTEWQFAVTTASSVKALVATRPTTTSSSSIHSNTKESSGSMVRGRIDSNVGMSRNVGQIEEVEEEGSRSDSSAGKPVKKPRVSGPRPVAEGQSDVEQAKVGAISAKAAVEKVQKAVVTQERRVVEHQEVRIAPLQPEEAEASLRPEPLPQPQPQSQPQAFVPLSPAKMSIVAERLERLKAKTAAIQQAKEAEEAQEAKAKEVAKRQKVTLDTEEANSSLKLADNKPQPQAKVAPTARPVDKSLLAGKLRKLREAEARHRDKLSAQGTPREEQVQVVQMVQEEATPKGQEVDEGKRDGSSKSKGQGKDQGKGKAKGKPRAKPKPPKPVLPDL